MVSFAAFRSEEGSPIYLQIIRFLKSGVAAGVVADGEELPSRRTLSALLGVNPNTVQKAYRLLEEEGLIRSHSGAASYVCADPARLPALRAELLEEGAAAVVRRMKALGCSREEALEQVGRLWDRPEEDGT